MQMTDIVSAEMILFAPRAESKAAALVWLAQRIGSSAGIDARTIETAVSHRETLGSTGMGAGVAIPHARLAAVQRPIGAFARIERQVDWEAIDDRPVDLVFLLLLPAEGTPSVGVSALATVARHLREAERLAALRSAKAPADMYEALVRA